MHVLSRLVCGLYPFATVPEVVAPPIDPLSSPAELKSLRVCDVLFIIVINLLPSSSDPELLSQLHRFLCALSRRRVQLAPKRHDIEL